MADKPLTVGELTKLLWGIPPETPVILMVKHGFGVKFTEPTEVCEEMACVSPTREWAQFTSAKLSERNTIKVVVIK
jgi:hypothetical protein